MLEFKLNYYFEKYKDTCIISTSKFKDIFKKENGEFSLLSELIVMIQRYQYKKYGNLIPYPESIIRINKKNAYNNKYNARMRTLFGTKEERRKRKLDNRW